MSLIQKMAESLKQNQGDCTAEDAARAVLRVVAEWIRGQTKVCNQCGGGRFVVDCGVCADNYTIEKLADELEAEEKE